MTYIFTVCCLVCSVSQHLSDYNTSFVLCDVQICIHFVIVWFVGLDWFTVRRHRGHRERRLSCHLKVLIKGQQPKSHKISFGHIILNFCTEQEKCAPCEIAK